MRGVRVTAWAVLTVALWAALESSAVAQVTLSSIGPVDVWIGLTNSDDVGIKFDLKAEVYRNNTTLIGSGELASVPGGSSGFNNAQLRTIPLTLVPGATLTNGATFLFKLSVRNACVGSGKNSGRMRLWYDDAAANSRFAVNGGASTTHYLHNATFNTTVGGGPKRTIDTQAGAKCSPYVVVGTWSGPAVVSAPTDTTAPVVTIAQPAAGIYTNATSIAVTGSVVEASTVSVAVSGVAATVTGTAPNRSFSATVPLGAGPSVTLQAVATDAASNVGQASVAVNVDRAVPTVAISAPANGAFVKGPTFTVSGTVTDSSPLTVSVNGVAASLTAGAFTATIPGSHGPLSIQAVATDAAGNTATAARTVTVDTIAPVITADVVPALNSAGWNNGPVSVTFLCSDADSGVSGCTAPVLATASGSQVVSGTATDGAGNTATVSVTLKIDTDAPTVTAAVSPAPNGNGWNNAPVTVHFSCADVGSGLVSCPTDQAVSADGVNVIVSGSATDVAGNETTASVTLNIDRTPPVVALAPPTAGANGFTANIVLSGTAADSGSGLASARCNGAPVAFGGGTFQCAVTLVPGSNTISAEAIDVAGNTSTTTVSVSYSPAPTVTITSPANLSYLNLTPTTITGAVDDATASVTINSVPATVNNGAFSLALPLAEGPNVVTATATTSTGAVATNSIEVTLDTTPPHVTITSPPDQYVTTAASLTIAGNVNDIVVGTVNDEQARVTVNGIDAQVANRSFLVTSVPLQVGLNVIQAVGRDRVGNPATTQITVTRQAPTAPHVQMVAGNNQTAPIGSELAAPIVVAVTDAAGVPQANATVVFKVTQNDGVVAASGPPAPMVTVSTDAQGRAQVRWTLGTHSGAGGDAVEAFANGYQGTALFTATATPGTPTRIVVDAGNEQAGAVGQALPRPFVAVVVDSGDNRLGGVPVTFTVRTGGGSFDGESTVTRVSDPDGRVAATLTLGESSGSNRNVADATFTSNPGLPSKFTAYGLVPGNPADTSVSGLVLDNSNLPIAGVIVRAVLTNELHSNAATVQSAIVAQTDAQGRFNIAQAPVGLVKLLVDGSTAEPAGTYPVLEYDLVTVPGRVNNVGQPIYLVPLNAANQLCVTNTTGGGTLTMQDAPGFSLTFGPGQVTFPGGSKSGCVSVTSVHPDKVPMAPSFGQQPRFVVTIQPAGATFNPPAALTIPNVDGLRPRQVTEMFSYDHDIGSFVSIGAGVVSDEGLLIRSSPGVGVLKAGWHGAGQTVFTGEAKSLPTPFVTITSDDLVVLRKGKSATATAEGGPTSGSYSWSLSRPAVAGVSGGSSATVTGNAIGESLLTVRYTLDEADSNGFHPFAEATAFLQVATSDVVVISWVNSAAVPIPDTGNVVLRASLATPLACSVLAGNWLISLPTLLYDGGDVEYANAYLLKHSGNNQPPPTIDPDAAFAQGDYRLFNRLQATFKNEDGVLSDFFAIKTASRPGVTPDPCTPLKFAPEFHVSNGAKGITFQNAAAYQLAEGRLGADGQRVSFTLNQRTVPWIWSIIRFDPTGALTPLQQGVCTDNDDLNSCFPTHYVYVDGTLAATFPQVPAGMFIARDLLYQKFVSQIR